MAQVTPISMISPVVPPATIAPIPIPGLIGPNTGPPPMPGSAQVLGVMPISGAVPIGGTAPINGPLPIQGSVIIPESVPIHGSVPIPGSVQNIGTGGIPGPSASLLSTATPIAPTGDGDKMAEHVHVPSPEDLAALVVHATAIPAAHVKRKGQPCFLCRKKLRYVYFISVVFAILTMVRLYLIIEMDGLPITDDSKFATRRLFVSAGAVAVLGISGLFVLVCNVSSMFLGILYMFACTATLYYCIITTSTAAYSRATDNFENAITHAKTEYDRAMPREIPKFMRNIQQRQRCCGWGVLYTTAWPKLLGGNDLPDSCCVNMKKDCGKGLITGMPSGVLYSAEASVFFKKFSPDGTINCTVALLGSAVVEQFRLLNSAGVPPNFLRMMDEQYAFNFGIDPSIALESGPLCPIWLYNDGTDLFLYKSNLLEEHRRLQGIIFERSCEPDEGDNTTRPFANFDHSFLKLIREKMLDVVIFGSILALLSVSMAVLFWYYFSRIKAKEMADVPVPRDFQELDLEATNFEGDNKFEDVDDATAARLQELQAARREKLHQKHHHRRAEAQAKAAATAAGHVLRAKEDADRELKDKKKRNEKIAQKGKEKVKEKEKEKAKGKDKSKDKEKDKDKDKDKRKDKGKDKKGKSKGK